ncbi:MULTISPECIES: hypothetical protein [Bradyrhizobium]|uniref:hypothetical protein n=1 Tax=Bradyrhizobium TaxID=374 RepID=UPI0004A60494|nr:MULTISPECIES: hypothetical protein [Bradyrhizobium]KIU45961.1 hypothetical protein QU41_24225 [Bradyrhizobium elkanii]OCX27005.1 hypothetical protein QU42_30210 [Bradyrhizobium sp. UASWS1016]
MRPVLAILLLCVLAAPGAHAQVLMRTDTNLVRVADCPIETPVMPAPDRSLATPDADSLSYRLDGYVFRRIQFSGLRTPTDVELVWTPENPTYPDKWHPPIEAVWTAKTMHITIGGNGTECFVNWFFAPNNVPGHIEVRAAVPLAGLTVSFSDRPWDKEGECPARALCPRLAKSLRECKSRHLPTSCDAFISTADRLTPAHQCRRRGDFEPVPAIWVCDEVVKPRVEGATLLEDTLHLLEHMTSAKARRFYRSAQFRGVLDGALAEEYVDDPRR